MTEEKTPQGEPQQEAGAQPPQAGAKPPEPGMVAVLGSDQAGNPTVDWVYPADLTGAETPSGEDKPGAPVAAPQELAPSGTEGLANAMKVLTTPEGRQALALLNQAQTGRQEAVRRAEETQREMDSLITRAGGPGEDAQQAKVELADRVIQQRQEGSVYETLMAQAQEEAYGQLYSAAGLTPEQLGRLQLLGLQGGSDEDILKGMLDMVVETRTQQQEVGKAEAQAKTNQELAEKHTGAPGGTQVPPGSEAQQQRRTAVSAPGPATPTGPGQTAPILPGQPVKMDEMFAAAAEQVGQGESG